MGREQRERERKKIPSPEESALVIMFTVPYGHDVFISVSPFSSLLSYHSLFLFIFLFFSFPVNIFLLSLSFFSTSAPGETFNVVVAAHLFSPVHLVVTVKYIHRSYVNMHQGETRNECIKCGAKERTPWFIKDQNFPPSGFLLFSPPSLLRHSHITLLHLYPILFFFSLNNI